MVRTAAYVDDAETSHDLAERVVIMSSITAKHHPVIASRPQAAITPRGQKVPGVALRHHEMAKRAALYSYILPEIYLARTSAMSRDANDTLLSAVHNIHVYHCSLAPFTMAYAFKLTVLPEVALHETAELSILLTLSFLPPESAYKLSFGPSGMVGIVTQPEQHSEQKAPGIHSGWKRLREYYPWGPLKPAKAALKAFFRWLDVQLDMPICVFTGKPGDA